MRPIRAIIWRAYEHLLLPILARRARRYIHSFEPRLSGVGQPLKVETLIRLLEQRKPHCIIEFGAGTNSTPCFAAYAKRNGAKFISFEAVPEWKHRATAEAAAFGSVEMHLANIEPSETGVRYVADIPEDADFIFVDGPTKAGHVPTMNVPLLLRSGLRPRTVVVDGRHPTIDAILQEAAPYDLAPDFHYAFVKERWRDLLPIRHESVFTLKA